MQLKHGRGTEGGKKGWKTRTQELGYHSKAVGKRKLRLSGSEGECEREQELLRARPETDVGRLM